jgi:hypothetical protein
MSNANITPFVLNKKGEINRLSISSDILGELSRNFDEEEQKFLDKESQIDYQPNYKPSEDELQVIHKYSLLPSIIDAIKNPINVQEFSIENMEEFDIRCLFIGKFEKNNNLEKIKIEFKRICKSYLLTKERESFWDLFSGDGNTYRKFESSIFSIPKDAQAFYDNGDLIFKSYKITNEMLDLSEYYRIATDETINEFFENNNDKIMMLNNNHKIQFNTRIRRLFATILDEEILQKNKIEDIEQCAISQKISLQISTDKKIILDPNNKKQLENTLNFLAQNTFVTTFSLEPQITNSRRKLS